jgi:hypothetical protein
MVGCKEANMNDSAVERIGSKRVIDRVRSIWNEKRLEVLTPFLDYKSGWRIGLLL